MNVLISAFILIGTSSMNLFKEMEKRTGRRGGRQ